jgi:hypothetical protein
MAKSFGTITVKCVHKNDTGKKRARTGGDNSKISPLGIVSEKALKGKSLTHSVE